MNARLRCVPALNRFTLYEYTVQCLLTREICTVLMLGFTLYAVCDGPLVHST